MTEGSDIGLCPNRGCDSRQVRSIKYLTPAAIQKKVREPFYTVPDDEYLTAHICVDCGCARPPT